MVQLNPSRGVTDVKTPPTVAPPYPAVMSSIRCASPTSRPNQRHVFNCERQKRVVATRLFFCLTVQHSEICIVPDLQRPNRESSSRHKATTRRRCAPAARFFLASCPANAGKFESRVMQWAVAVLKNDKAVFSALAAPPHAFTLCLEAESPGRSNSGTMQKDYPKFCMARNSKAGEQSRPDAFNNERTRQ